jgi:hypothetical protein
LDAAAEKQAAVAQAQANPGVMMVGPRGPQERDAKGTLAPWVEPGDQGDSPKLI